MKKINGKVFILLTLLTMPLFGEKITVQTSTEKAIKNNRDIKKGMLELEKSRLDVDKAWKTAYFKVSYTVSANRYFKEIKSPLTGSYNQSYGHNVALTQPIYAGGAIKTGISIGKDALSLAELNLDKIKKETVLSTVQAYIDVYDAENSLGVLEKSREALSKNYEIQKGKYELRMVTKPEFIESERSLKEVEASIIEMKSNIEIAKEALGILIGYSDSSKIEIVPFGVEENFSKKVNLKDDLVKISSQNTEYQMALKQKQISGKTIDIKKADLRPTIAGVLTYGTSNNTKFSNLTKEKNYNGTVGLSFSWDIFDWGARRLEVKKAEKEYEIKGIEADQALDAIKVNMKKVYYQLQALEKSLEAKRIAVEKAEEVYELEQERYSYNLITMKALLDAETNLRQNRTDYESTRLKYYYLISRYGSFLD